MSRIGNKPIEIPAGVTVDVAPGRVTVNGPKGELTPGDRAATWTVKVDDGVLTVARPTDRGEHRALHGLTRSLIANMVEGVTNGFEKRLQIQGVGYRAKAQGKALELSLGFSHPVNVQGAGRDRLRGPAADRDHRPRHRQAARRRDGGADPPPPAAGALQGQGRALRRRAGPPQGRQAGVGEELQWQSRPRTEKAAAAAPRPREDPRHRESRPRLAVYRSNRGLYAQLIDDDRGHTIAQASWTEADLRKLDAARAGEEGRRAARRARQEGRRRDLRLRSRRLPLPRPGRRPRRGRPRGRSAILTGRRDETEPRTERGADEHRRRKS